MTAATAREVEDVRHQREKDVLVHPFCKSLLKIYCFILLTEKVSDHFRELLVLLRDWVPISYVLGVFVPPNAQTAKATLPKPLQALRETHLRCDHISGGEKIITVVRKLAQSYPGATNECRRVEGLF